EQIPRPGDGRPQRAVALGEVDRTVGQGVEAGADVAEDLARPALAQHRGGELDGQGKAGQLCADGVDGVARVRVHPGAGRLGPVDEELAGREAIQSLERDLVLRPEAELLTAGGQHAELWNRFEEA